MARQTDDYMAMKGAGYYSRATIGAKHVMDNATGLILDALQRQPPKDDGSVFTMTDMGTADGGTSLEMVGNILGAVRQAAPSRPLRMVYTDLPSTDYRALFQNVHGISGEQTYADMDNLFIHASATSFHRQIIPAGTLDLGHSATASHYITEVPCQIADHVHMVGATGDVRQAYQDKGAADWQNFLLHRATELKSGGLLALFNFGIDEQGQWLGHTGGVSMFDTFNRLWAEMVADGIITDQEYAGTNFPQVYRTTDEFRAPFTTGPVKDAGLSVEHFETRVTRCPFAADFEDHRDAHRFAQSYIPTLRSWSEPVFLAGLSPSRTPQDRAAIVDDFYGRYQALVAGAPEGHAMDYVHAYMICRKS